MTCYLLTPAADADLDSIWSYVEAASGMRRADALENRLHLAMRRLARSPGLGRPNQQLADEALRVYRVTSYLIIYRDSARPIEIVRVLHGARDVGAVLESERWS